MELNGAAFLEMEWDGMGWDWYDCIGVGFDMLGEIGSSEIMK